MKNSFFIFFLSCFILLFNSCDEFLEESPEIGMVRYEINSKSNYFHVGYLNEYGNDIIELVQGSTSWVKEIEIEEGELVHLKFDEGPEQYGYDNEVLTTLSISFNGNTLISYSGITEYEYINCYLED